MRGEKPGPALAWVKQGPAFRNGECMSAKRTVTVVGAGLMGTAIATLYAAHGYRVVLHDQNAAKLDDFRDRAGLIAESLSSPTNSGRQILDAITWADSLEESIREAFLVQETIHEDLQAKKALFATLDRLCAPNVILGTNTSSFLLSEICETIKGRERVIGVHYVSPAHIIRAVEIITASFTPPSLVSKVQEFVRSIDHVGIVCRERPGFLINRIQYALKAEVQRLVDEGVASVEDIDAAVRLSIGPRLALWGPMMQEDLCASKKTVLAVTEYIHQATGETHFASTAILRKLAQSGQTGATAGAGWYRWDSNSEHRETERDRQLNELLTWLRQNDRRAVLGAGGSNV